MSIVPVIVLVAVPVFTTVVCGPKQNRFPKEMRRRQQLPRKKQEISFFESYFIF
jgi:Zn ribbon nucleic-acid-binding protein